MVYNNLQEAFNDIKPQIKKEEIRKYFINTIIDFINTNEEKIRQIIKYSGKFELKVKNDVFLRIVKCSYNKPYTMGEEEIFGDNFFSKKEGYIPLDFYLLINKSDGYNTINWETQKEYFLNNYKEILQEFMERNKING